VIGVGILEDESAAYPVVTAHQPDQLDGLPARPGYRAGQTPKDR
jgi:hypothetical protein